MSWQEDMCLPGCLLALAEELGSVPHPLPSAPFVIDGFASSFFPPRSALFGADFRLALLRRLHLERDLGLVFAIGEGIVAVGS